MCGISGELRTDGCAPDQRAVAAMTAAQADRGPDGSGHLTHGSLALGHRRLAIIDLSDRSRQPMADTELGLSIVFNGCIYNYPQLRAELQAVGYAFRTSGDTEVLLKAYHRWGDDFVSHLVGMFAFCIAERDSGACCWAATGSASSRSTSPRPRAGCASPRPCPLLAAGDVDTSIDRVALHHYLTFHSVVPAPRTILAGVRKLAPATTLAIEPDGRRSERRYWEPLFLRRSDQDGWSARDWTDAIAAALRLAVERRLVADVGVGVLLSGGLDSSLITALMAEAGQTDLATFSVGFEAVGGTAGDEFAYSDLVAKTFGTDQHQIRVPAEALVPALSRAVGAMSEPMISHDAVGFSLLSEEVSRSIKVVQSGQGADEVFAGYHWYPRMAVPGAGLDTYAAAFFDRTHAEMAQVVAPEYRLDADVSRAFAQTSFAADGADTPADRALRLDTTVMLVDDPVKRVDNMTMAWGLEARVPFLDHELVELAAACPPELKVAQGGKWVLKDVARGLVPAEVIDRPKGYFPVPVLTHLRGPDLELVCGALEAPEAKQRGLFVGDEVARLIRIADDGGEELTRLRGNKLWQLGLLELWRQAHGVRP